MLRDRKRIGRGVLAGTAIVFGLLPWVASAEVLTAKVADPTEQGDGTMSAAARASMDFGARPVGAAHIAAKAAANRAARQSAVAGPAAAGAGSLATISGGHTFDGQFEPNSTPPDTTGAIGTTRYVQLVNTRFGIYNRSTNALISEGTLNELAGLAASVNTFDPQIIWDAQTDRFYYVNDSIFSASDHRLSWGFSKTASPNSAADFCHYTTPFGTRFPDYPKLGDSRYFTIVGVNSFVSNSYAGSDIIAFSKPPSGTTCPAVSAFKINSIQSIKDIDGAPTFTPVPANQIDVNSKGYVVAESAADPSTKLWFRSVARLSTGFASFGAPRAATVVSYGAPPDAAAGIGSTRKLDTLDARMTQAVQAINPARSPDTFSFYTQHTIRSGTVSAVRWYEIDPVPAVPVVLRQSSVRVTDTFVFNGAISPDRRVRTGQTSRFGASFVLHYTMSKSTAPGINPRIVAGSSFNLGAVGSFLTVKNSLGPYVDFSCAGTTQTCRWGDYAGANPDPASSTSDNRGVVWGTNQWGSGGTSVGQSNWRTRIFALRP